MKTTMRTFLLILITLLLFARQSVDAQTGDISKLNEDLVNAAGDGHTETVQVLRDAGADVNARNNAGETALMMAATLGHTKAVQALLDADANVNDENNVGDTVLMMATRNGHDEVVRLLKSAGAKR